MQVFDEQGRLTLSDISQSMKLTDSGSVSSIDVSNTGIYEYDANVTVPDSSRPFLFCVKSDFDKLTLGPSNYDPTVSGPSNVDIKFFSSFSGPKEYRLYTTFDFESYSTTTNFGMKLFSPDGNISYDSRVPEAIFEDLLQITTSNETITHSSISTPFYAINLFPVSQGLSPIGGGRSVFRRRGLQQISSTEREILFIDMLIINQFQSQSPTNFASNVPIVTSLGI